MLIANERADRIERVTKVVLALGHVVVGSTDVAEVMRDEARRSSRKLSDVAEAVAASHGLLPGHELEPG